MSMMKKHRTLVRNLKKDPADIQPTSEQMDMIHMALGIAGEAGEVVDLIKKAVVNGHDVDPTKIVMELGDVMFYIQGLLDMCGRDLDECLHGNILKLTKRYPDGYNDKASVDRVDVA